MEKMVYTVKEVAKLLGISRSYAYELVKEKKLPVLDLGRRKVIPKNRFDEWIRENSVYLPHNKVGDLRRKTI